jgi:hypothetical protein
MHLTYHTIDLKLKHPFRISRSVTESKKNVISLRLDIVIQTLTSWVSNERR